MLSATYIKESARTSGFDLCGITSTHFFEGERAHYMQWIEEGKSQALPYMQQYMDVRFDPACIMEGCTTAVVCAINYKSQHSLAQRDSRLPKVASYALNIDYHKTIRKALKALLKRLQEHYPALGGRCCVDTAPLLEKHLATRAGLGWIGRQSLVVTPEHGSFVVLGVLLLDQMVDTLDEPYQGAGCGSCRRCIEACPNGAIGESKTIDSRLCISAQTVECDATTTPLSGWIFGCDECQACCPHNQRTPLATNPNMQPIFAPLTAEQWQSITTEEFTEHLSRTPLKRAGIERIIRNLVRSCFS